MFCSNCGNEIKQGKTFCEFCGTELDALSIENERNEEEGREKEKLSQTVQTTNEITDDEEVADNTSPEIESLSPETNDSTEEGGINEDKDSELVADHNSSDNEEAPNSEKEEGITNTGQPKKNNKLLIIVGGIIAAIVIVVIIVFATRPSLESIDVEYSGDKGAGTVIDESSDITVTAYYDDGSEETIDEGWTINGDKLDIGDNNYEVEYDGKKCDLNIYSPVMENGKIVATRKQIENEFQKKAKEKTEWFESFGKEEKFGKEINGLDSSYKAYFGVNKNKKTAGENDIPDTILLTADIDLNSGSLDVYKEMTALVLYTIDPDLDWDDAKEKMDSENNSAFNEYLKKLKNNESVYLYEKKLDNETIAIAFVPVSNTEIAISTSFQELKDKNN